MPMQKATGGFSLAKVLKAQAPAEVDYGVDLSKPPGGISGGVAELVECKIGTFKTGDDTGKKFFYAAGVIIEPKTATETVMTWNATTKKAEVVSVREVKVEGRRTTLMIRLCDTKNSKQEVTSAQTHAEDMANELKKLGGKECLDGIESDEDVEALLVTLKEARPRFKFSTTAGTPTAQYPKANVFENWYGTKGLENYVEQEANHVQDNTAAAPSANGDIAPDQGDLDSLVATASEDGDSKAALAAREALRGMALKAGVSEEDVDVKAQSWAEVKEMIEQVGSAPAEPETEKPWEPEKDQVFFHTLVDAKGKPIIKNKKTQKVECEVTVVDRKNRTVTLLNLDDKKTTYKSISWDALPKD